MIKTTDFDYFTQEELISICKAADGQDQAAVTAAAELLFPDRMHAEQPPMLMVETGLHGRCFRRKPDAPVEAPVVTVKSGRCNWVGIMEDGEILPY